MRRWSFDEGPGIGLGHRRRIEVLAAELDGLGFELVARRSALDECVTAELLVVDSYLARADDRVRFTAEVVVAIDDIWTATSQSIS